MAVDVDSLIRTHLEKMVTQSNNPLYQEAKKLIDEIRIGLYMTKFELVNANLMDQDGRLCLTAGNVLNFICQRYQVQLPENEKEVHPETDDSEDMFDFLLDSEDQSNKSINNEKDKDREKAIENVIDNLCIKMLLLNAEIDTDKSKKREYIEKLIHILQENREVVLADCNCKFNVDRDDKGGEFISSLRVEFIDGETKIYQHMVCPHCGEPFFIHAGKYEERVIVMLGSSRVGKTAYLEALVDTINPEYGQTAYPNIIVKDTSDAKYISFIQKYLKRYRQGKKTTKTDEQKEAVALISLEVSVNGKNLIMTLVDLPGEVFAPRGEEEKTGEASGRFIINHRKICYSADAFWFCIDPVQIDYKLHKLNELNEENDKVELDFGKILSNIENLVNIMRSDGDSDSKREIPPTAVIITKSDLIDNSFNLYNSNGIRDCLENNEYFRVDELNGIATNVRNYMQSGNTKNIVGKLDSMFQKKNYFSVAAYGRNVNEEEGEKAPYGIMLPFLWTLTNFGYLKTVKLERSVKTTGFLHKTTDIIDSIVEADRQELFLDS
jgi:hypothetical protein